MRSFVPFYKLFKVNSLSFSKEVEDGIGKEDEVTHISLLGPLLQGFGATENRWINSVKLIK
jgi:hypothetical protein